MSASSRKRRSRTHTCLCGCLLVGSAMFCRTHAKAQDMLTVLLGVRDELRTADDSWLSVELQRKIDAVIREAQP